MGQERNDLRRTRASLFYLVAYLFPLAAGLLISPTDTFHLLGSRAEHATHCVEIARRVAHSAGNGGGTALLRESARCQC